MLKMSVPVVVNAFRDAKEKGVYCDFAFFGGLISLPVDKVLLEKLRALNGSEFNAVFEMRSKIQVLYGERAVTVFQPVTLLEVVADHE